MKVVVSSSCRFSNDWPELGDKLGGLGIDLYLPDKKDLEGLSQEETDRIMETVNRDFFAQIDTSDILYIYCPEGYIGKGVACEIGYAIAKNIEVIASDVIDDIGVWSLVNKIKNVDEFIKYLGNKNEL
jgi:nucleoside 2-deoxyribosyltransferase